MIPLDPSNWTQLTHAYGVAIDTPDLIKQLAGNPAPSDDPDSEPWFSLWSSLCHQGDVFSASYAAVPHIIEICASCNGPIGSNFFFLPACVEISRKEGRGPDLSDALAHDYFEALQRLPDCAYKQAANEWDENMTLCITAALAASKGQVRLARTIANLDDDIMDRIVREEF